MTIYSPPLDALELNRKSVKLGVLASGSGSNFEAIVDSVESGLLNAEVVVVVCNEPEAKVFERARRLNVTSELISHREFSSRQEFDSRVARTLREHGVEWVAMAGWMRISSAPLFDAFEGRILNLHPSILPAFRGYDAVGQALKAGAQITGCTVHVVTEGVDEGPIVAQAAIAIAPDDDSASLHRKIHALEHQLYPRAISHAIALAERRETTQENTINAGVEPS